MNLISKLSPVLITIMCSLQMLNAQVVGQVINEKGEPLGSVNIYIDKSFQGTTTNADGNYELKIEQTGNYTIVFQYLGYKTERKQLEINSLPYQLDIVMQEMRYTLDEVVVGSEENPANRIMRNAIRNRKTIAEKIKSYKAEFYSRGLIRIKDAPEKILGQEIGDLGGGLDSTRSGIIYLSETISEIAFEHPDKLYEKIKASKVSGNDNGFSFNTASDVNFSFYNNTVELGSQIVSPIADYAFNYYRFELEGVNYDQDGNLINKIKVIPKRKNDRVFEGHIYIVEDQWAIYASELQITGEQAQIPPADTISLSQSFSFSETDKIWVLISQNIDFNYGIFGITGSGSFKAVYSNYRFKPDFEPRTFTNEILAFDPAANKKEDDFWKITRPVPLTMEEAEDYIKKDSIQIIRKSKKYLDSIDRKANQFKPLQILTGYNHQNSYTDNYWNISGLISAVNFNTVQGWNPRVDIKYVDYIDEFRRYFQVRGFLNYGFSEEKLRGTAILTFKFNQVSRPFLDLSAGVTVEQFNPSEPISPMINTLSSLLFESNFMKLYERSFVQTDYSHEWFNGFRFRTNFSYEKRSPLFNNTTYTTFDNDDLSYTSNNPIAPQDFDSAPFVEHNLFKFRINSTISIGQKYLMYPNEKVNIPNDNFPRINLFFETGFGASESDYNYTRLQTRIWQGFDVGNKGTFQYNLIAGTFFNGDDIAFMDYKHVNGNQTKVGTSFNYLNVFNNLPYYELSTNSSYFEAHAEHDFKGYILGKIPGLNALNFNLVLGAHLFATENRSPYKEFSIGLDNIGFKKFRFLRLDYVRSYQDGFRGDTLVFGLKFLDFIN